MGIKQKLLDSRKRFKRIEVTDPAVLALLEGERLFVSELSAAARDDYERSRVTVSFDAKGNSLPPKINLENTRARLLVLCLESEDGAKIFEPADAAALGAILPASLADTLFEMATQVNGMSKAADETLQAEAAKN